jgi:uncharacterized membrane protein HdeD (DUF308 family)
MKLGYRKARFFILLFAGLLALGLSRTMDGYSVVLGISLLVSSALTLVYVFLHFDENINPKIVMEMITDGFSGLVIFTYPVSNENFLLIVFSFWIVFMGILLLTSGLLDEENKDYLWLYALTGIISMVLGFVVMHYDAAYKSSVLYVVGFTLLIYAGMNLYLLFKRKREIY